MARRLHARGITLALLLGTLAVPLAAHPAAAGGGCHLPVSDRTGTSVTIQDLCFSATVLRIQPGQTVTWRNKDSFPHLVTGANATWGVNAELQGGQSYSHRFAQPGIYPYSCMLHYGMNAVVVVGDPSKASGAAGVAPAAPAGGAAPAASAAKAAPASSSTPWRVAALVGFVLFLVAGLALATQRLSVRRARARA
jgi:plastocyanin